MKRNRQPLHSRVAARARGGYWVENWARNQRSIAAERSSPRSEQELREFVRQVARRGGKLKIVGGGHSWSDVAHTRGATVSLDRLARFVHIDRERRRVRVEAGIRLHALCDVLRREGLALPVLGSIAEQSIAGAISTGTHGSGVRFGNLATAVRALRVVLASGQAIEVTPERDVDLFRALTISVGLCGIITEVELGCEPAFDLEEVQYPVPFARAVAEVDEIARSAEHVKLWWLPYTDQVQVYAASRTRRARTPVDGARRFAEGPVLRRIAEGLLWLGARRPALVPAIDRLTARQIYRRETRVDRGEFVYHVPQVPRHRETEFALGHEHAGASLVTLRDIVERRRLPVSFIQELRFVAADEAWLSPAYGRATCQLGAYMRDAPGIEQFFAEFEDRMLALGGRPHWGKEFAAGASQLRSAFPRYDDFARLRATLDPHGLFDNAFSERCFPR